jgi:hypothetical protein
MPKGAAVGKQSKVWRCITAIGFGIVRAPQRPIPNQPALVRDVVGSVKWIRRFCSLDVQIDAARRNCVAFDSKTDDI